MILQGLLTIVETFFDILFDLLPNIPSVSPTLSTTITYVLDLIFDNAGIVGFFVDITLMQTLLPLVLIIVNADHIYHFFMWIIKKIPGLNVS